MRKIYLDFAENNAYNLRMKRVEYIHRQPGWPKFHWKLDVLSAQLAGVRHRQGRLIGRMEGIGFHGRNEAILRTLAQDVLKSSEIEGEILNADQVRSSIARRLGLDIAGLAPADRRVEGVVEMMLDATQKYAEPLTAERICAWHAALFPTGRSGMHKITVGAWRTDEKGPMQVVSGVIGRERVHYVAPTAKRLDTEMRTFLKWVNRTGDVDPVLRAGQAHLWFVTLHPFDDGNGRIARAIADWALARSEERPDRFYSMSAQIQKEREAYYAVLEKAQKSTIDITDWMAWFLGCLDRALAGAESELVAVFQKDKFWKTHAQTPFNDRQRLLLNKMLDGLEGKMTSSKWAKMSKCSQDTAGRDIVDLMERGILNKDRAGGRSTSYSLG